MPMRITFRTGSTGNSTTDGPLDVGEPMWDPVNQRFGIGNGGLAPLWYPSIKFFGNSNYTVSTLPNASISKYQKTFVTDSTVASTGNFGATPIGGGNNIVPVYSDGTGWFIG